ncbi:MAG: heavy-metal-associated domain-containing protein, partial [Burkholderiaceae bacterium]|nr:heavy-metal-associated domain-containing protein [Burkholderiaceae bacterium]
MKTSTIEVQGLVSTLSAAGVQRQLATLPGVAQVDVNYVAGSATVRYDEARVTLEALRKRVADCGYHCSGELVPKHVCPAADHATAKGGTAKDAHAGHAAVHPAAAKSGRDKAGKKPPAAPQKPDLADHAGHAAP